MQIKDIETGYYWARHNGHGHEWLAQNISWRPVEVLHHKGPKSFGVWVYEFACATAFAPEHFEFGERIVKE